MMATNSLKHLKPFNSSLKLDDIAHDFLEDTSISNTVCLSYLQLSSYDEALKQAEQIIKQEPHKPDGYVFKARALFQKGRYEEAEEALLKVMKIAEKSGLIRRDSAGVVKLKDELANSRVEILRSRGFRDTMDIAEMHWNDCHTPILQLIDYDSNSRGGGGQNKVLHQKKVDLTIVDIIGAKKAKQLYPELFIDSPINKSTPISKNHSNYSQRHTTVATDFSKLNLREGLPIRYNERHSIREPELKHNTCGKSRDRNDYDLTLKTDALKRALLAAEEKNKENELKIKNLEQELKKVYQRVIKLNSDNKFWVQRNNRLVSMLDTMVGTKKTSLFKFSSLKTVNKDNPDVPIVRELYHNNKKKFKVSTKRVNSYKPVSGHRFTGFKQTSKQNLGQNISPRKMPMVFTNSIRRDQIISDIITGDNHPKEQIPKMSYMSEPNPSSRSAPEMGFQFWNNYQNTDQYKNPTLMHWSQVRDKKKAEPNATQRTIAPSFLGMD